MVDRFADAKEGAVLTAQIAAGGVGLNIQTASVITSANRNSNEPPKPCPSPAYRMCQVHSVQVHQPLFEEGVDEHTTEILTTKRHFFDKYAHIIATADSC